MMKYIAALVVAATVMPLPLSAYADTDHHAESVDAHVAAARAYAQRPGEQFHDKLSDGSAGPEMIVIPAGRFEMGSPSDETDRKSNEGPVHEVTLKMYALGRTEVTRGEFAIFVRATGYKTDAERNTAHEGCFAMPDGDEFKPDWKAGTSWRDPGYAQGDDHPVACVSWNDATAYTEWLRRETGKPYRLPSESEQEYVIRAGSTSPWPWGPDPNGGCGTSNGADATLKAGLGKQFGLITRLMTATSSCDDGFYVTAAAGRLKPNAFGLYDTTGNVSEWSQDCYMGYDTAPADGSPHEKKSGCGTRAVRGGTWSDEPAYLRSAARNGVHPTDRYLNIGLRVARDL